MKLQAFLIPALLFASTAQSSEKASTLVQKVPLETLLERSIGYAKRPSVVEWRKKNLILNVEMGQFIEYNNFDTSSWGFNLRFPSESFLVKSAVLKVETEATEASQQIAKTPFQQAGRPSRWEWQNGIEFPVLEGIGNQLFSFIPTSQCVLSAVAQLNLNIYPKIASSPMDMLKGLYQTRLSADEIRRLQEDAPASMRILRSRHNVGVGLQWDNYYKSGISWNTRFMYERPVTSLDDKMKAWYSVTFGAGYAF
ncbi:MAG TPA: hypothetical protein VE954_07230 [Oligoflexus sp.]|uniref:hypothetical protein n=1 Tax=Oligoflexus sp. TaxID=1971216 RepID=UPI002D37B1CB|nr:hypothetical protein [Oligoflexus sp.]HYX32890.1 hypothetical protein [Oligoflexus sp.]